MGYIRATSFSGKCKFGLVVFMLFPALVAGTLESPANYPLCPGAKLSKGSVLILVTLALCPGPFSVMRLSKDLFECPNALGNGHGTGGRLIRKLLSAEEYSRSEKTS